LGLATRQDEYDELSTNIGDRRTDSATFAWRPTSRLLIRGSWGESFKAPSLPYIYKGDTTAYSSPCDTYGLWLNTGSINANCSGFNQINTPIISGGNLDLVEEEGENFSVGFVFDVIDTSTLVMDLTFDLFQVELENVTSNISSAGLARDEGICRVQADGGDTEGIFYSASYCADVISKVVRGAEYRPSNGNDPDVKPTIGSFSRINVTPLNKGYLFFQGADISTSARYLSEDAGDFYVSFAMSYVHDERRADEAGEEPYSLWDGGYLYRLRTKSYFSIGWDYNKWTTGVNFERWGHMEGGDGKISPYNETGVFAQYRFDPAGKQYIQVNINNIFDAIPDKVSTLAWPFFQDALLPAVGPEVFVSYRYTF
jgi:outer membrane receptor protein involved in Fe transport